VIVGKSPAILRALSLVERFAGTQLPFLLVGQTGTGKELFAEHIHRLSRRTGSFVDLNCGALPRDMVESLLFGHRRGAFTGANESVQGHIERSHGGTLFLDELTTLAPEGQVKLLRVIETGAVQPLGAPGKRLVDLRIVSAVQEGILRQIDLGHFRRDLYQRVAGIVVELPPLAARPEDIVPLARHFAGRGGKRLEPEAEAVLVNYSWPGNVRELRLALDRAAALVDNGTLPSAAVAEGIALGAPADAASHSRQRRNAAVMPRSAAIDPAHLVTICESMAWRIEDAAKVIGVSRASLYRRLQALGIPLRRLKSQSH
jgi:transcriptional regulator with PAS, ATPase and Fis domain